jgi:hypothetical protein
LQRARVLLIALRHLAEQVLRSLGQPIIDQHLPYPFLQRVVVCRNCRGGGKQFPLGLLISSRLRQGIDQLEARLELILAFLLGPCAV